MFYFFIYLLLARLFLLTYPLVYLLLFGFFACLRHLQHFIKSLKFFFFTSSPREVFLEKDILKYAVNVQENPCPSVISIKLQKSNFTEITLRHGCSPVNLLYNLRTPFSKNTSGGLLLSSFSIFDFTFGEALVKRTST